MRGLSKSFDAFAGEQKLNSSASYLGRQVTLQDPSGEVKGIVDAITLKDGIPAIVVGGKTYETKLITGISMPPAPATTTPATTEATGSITNTGSTTPPQSTFNQ